MSKSDEQIEQRDRVRAKRAEAKELPSLGSGKGGVADWAGAEATLVLQLVCSVGAVGGAVRYGYTRDGGAYSIGIYIGDGKKTYYCNEKDGINETLEELNEFFKK